MNDNIFGCADILLPPYSPDDCRYTAWSVVACDQFTSEPEYWKQCRALVANNASTYNFILPEAYLSTPLANEHEKTVADSMRSASAIISKELPSSFVYIERTLPDGSVRPGIVGKIDLEAYDYNKGSTSPVRATEATVLDRIPPRRAIRAKATVELPHVMLLTDDPDMGMYKFASTLESELLYDFDLMLGGGHIVGRRITGDSADRLADSIREYESSRIADPASVVYAVGDGNHSLAAAKAHFENLKASLGDAAMTHPARWALVEIVSLHSDSLEFEPIYRLVKDCDTAALVEHIKTFGSAASSQKITLVSNGIEQEISIASPTHALTVGSLQNILDDYLSDHDGECDYIHGEDTLRSLASADGCVGFLFDGVRKDQLFDYVSANGALPRKTFSMGEARSKRYYTEARRIIV